MPVMNIIEAVNSASYRLQKTYHCGIGEDVGYFGGAYRAIFVRNLVKRDASTPICDKNWFALGCLECQTNS